jgi:fructose-1,6-bisphosphatase II
MQVIALAERGTLYDPGPCMYMEKLAVGPSIPAESVSLNKSVSENLKAVSEALGKPVRCARFTLSMLTTSVSFLPYKAAPF